MNSFLLFDMPTSIPVGKSVPVTVSYDGTVAAPPTAAVVDSIGSPLSGVLAVAGPSPPTTNSYQFTVSAQAEGTGQVRFYATGSAGQIVSYFSFTSASPPTATAATVSVGAPY